MVRTNHEFRPPKSTCVMSGGKIPVYIKTTEYFVIKLNENLWNMPAFWWLLQTVFNPNMRVHLPAWISIRKWTPSGVSLFPFRIRIATNILAWMGKVNRGLNYHLHHQILSYSTHSAGCWTTFIPYGLYRVTDFLVFPEKFCIKRRT